MKTAQVTEALKTCISASLPVLLVGPPGVGKSDLVAQAASALEADLIISHPALGDPTDVKGLPWPGSGRTKHEARFLPFGDLARALAAKKPTVWFLDDLGQATNAMQAAYMQLLLARRVNEHVLPDCVTFVAATNRRSDRAGVNGILEPVKSRFATIIHVEPNLDDWCNWSIEAGIPAELRAFLRFRPHLLCDVQPTADMTNSPSPRTWAQVGKLMKAGVPQELEQELFAGAVGEGAAREFVAHLKEYRNLPNLDAILLDPDQAMIPKEPSALFAVAAGLASRATEGNFGRIVRYAKRLLEQGHGEFAVLLIRDSCRVCPAVQHTAAFRDLSSSELGQLIAA